MNPYHEAAPRPVKCKGDSACWGEVAYLVNLGASGAWIRMCPDCARRYGLRGWNITLV